MASIKRVRMQHGSIMRLLPEGVFKTFSPSFYRSHIHVPTLVIIIYENWPSLLVYSFDETTVYLFLFCISPVLTLCCC